MKKLGKFLIQLVLYSPAIIIEGERMKQTKEPEERDRERNSRRKEKVLLYHVEKPHEKKKKKFIPRRRSLYTHTHHPTSI
jgi:hypothetical protein